MPRITKVSWICSNCRTSNAGLTRFCSKCGTNHYEKCAQIHSSERAVVYENPNTGERRIPPRADMPMPPQYEQQGFERREIMSMTQFERETGLVNESTNFRPGNEPDPEDARDTVVAPPGLKEALINDMRDAFSSGEWTGGENIVGEV